MKRINVFLAICSIITFSFISCENTTRVSYRVQADWNYINKSSTNIEIKGIEDFSYTSKLEIEMEKDSNYIISFDETGGEDVSSDEYPMPQFKEKCHIIIDSKNYNVADSLFFRNRKNYQIEKISFNNYKFTYTFTDEIIEEIIKLAEIK